MNEISIKSASDSDLDLLAELNKQLIEDEKHDNKMNIPELKERMKGFIHSGYIAYLFVSYDTVIGYSLVDSSRKPIYLRHFFICRRYRRSGYGTLAFNYLMSLLNTDTIDIEVMIWNNTAIGFYRSLGFKDRSILMRKTI